MSSLNLSHFYGLLSSSLNHTEVWIMMYIQCNKLSLGNSLPFLGLTVLIEEGLASLWV